MEKSIEKPSSLYEKIYEIVAQIPFGKVTTYGHIAKVIGAPQAARMVGWAMNASHQAEKEIPAHRVVNRNGMLTGKAHFATPTLMQKRLEAEGIVIINDQIQNFKEHLWQPKNK